MRTRARRRKTQPDRTSVTLVFVPDHRRVRTNPELGERDRLQRLVRRVNTGTAKRVPELKPERSVYGRREDSVLCGFFVKCLYLNSVRISREQLRASDVNVLFKYGEPGPKTHQNMSDVFILYTSPLFESIFLKQFVKFCSFFRLDKKNVVFNKRAVQKNENFGLRSIYSFENHKRHLNS